MTDTPTPPDGWYPDPAGGGGTRRWDGTAWTDEVRPAGAVPVAGAGVGAPAVASPAHDPGYPAAASASAAGHSAAAPASVPGYPAAAPASTHPAIPTDTVWVWLMVALPLVSVVSLFLFDWRSIFGMMAYAAVSPEQGAYAVSSSVLMSTAFGVVSLVVSGLSVLFAFLDWRQLQARGIHKPFPWAWSFFVFVVSSGVYVVGRCIVVHRQTGRGLGPVWGFIAVTVMALGLAFIWTMLLVQEILTVVQHFSVLSGT